MNFRWLFRKRRDVPISSPSAMNCAQTAVEAIAQIAAAGDALAIPELIDHLFSANRGVQDAAKDAISRLLSAVAPAQLPILDEKVRSSAAGSYSPQWRALQPNQLSKWVTGSRGCALLGLASFHSNGRVREEAVRRIATMHDVSALGFLLVRANDWVGEVRQQAQSAALGLSTIDNAVTWVSNLPLVSRLEQCGRASHAELIASVQRLLREPACHRALIEGLGSTDQEVRRACLRVVERMETAGAAPFLKRASLSPDPLLRLRAAALLLEQTPSEAITALGGELQRDPFMPVRRLGLEAVIARAPDGARDLLLQALADRHASIRELARFHLARLEQIDVRSFYLDLLQRAAGSILAVALVGLGESGKGEDFEQTSPFLVGAPTHLRKAALHAAARLDLQRALPYLVAALADESPGVSRQAARSLGAHAELVSYDELLSLISTDLKPHVRRNAFRLLLHRSKWERLHSILVACSDGDARVRAMGESAVRRWLWSYNRSFAQPRQEQIESATAALDRAATHLSLHIQRELRAALTGWTQ